MDIAKLPAWIIELSNSRVRNKEYRYVMIIWNEILMEREILRKYMSDIFNIFNIYNVMLST